MFTKTVKRYRRTNVQRYLAINRDILKLFEQLSEISIFALFRCRKRLEDIDRTIYVLLEYLGDIAMDEDEEGTFLGASEESMICTLLGEVVDARVFDAIPGLRDFARSW